MPSDKRHEPSDAREPASPPLINIEISRKDPLTPFFAGDYIRGKVTVDAGRLNGLQPSGSVILEGYVETQVPRGGDPRNGLLHSRTPLLFKQDGLGPIILNRENPQGFWYLDLKVPTKVRDLSTLSDPKVLRNANSPELWTKGWGDDHHFDVTDTQYIPPSCHLHHATATASITYTLTVRVTIGESFFKASEGIILVPSRLEHMPQAQLEDLECPILSASRPLEFNMLNKMYASVVQPRNITIGKPVNVQMTLLDKRNSPLQKDFGQPIELSEVKIILTRLIKLRAQEGPNSCNTSDKGPTFEVWPEHRPEHESLTKSGDGKRLSMTNGFTVTEQFNIAESIIEPSFKTYSVAREWALTVKWKLQYRFGPREFSREFSSTNLVDIHPGRPSEASPPGVKIPGRS